MSKREIVTGILIDDRTVTLDKPLRLPPTKVRLAIEPLDANQHRLYRPDVIVHIHAAQAARGYRPPTREEVDQRVQAERDGWND